MEQFCGVCPVLRGVGLTEKQQNAPRRMAMGESFPESQSVREQNIANWQEVPLVE